jgi:hypothetical protein
MGQLKHVHRYAGDPYKVYLVIESDHHGTLVGTLEFDDHHFSDRVTQLLRGKIGWHVKEIGDLEL